MSLIPTLEDAFAVGKLEGEKECIKFIQELIDQGSNPTVLKTILNAKLKVLSVQITNNPFGVNKSNEPGSKF